MNIYKKAKLRNLTNEELERALKDSNWQDRDLLREYDERCKNGLLKLKAGSLEEHFRLVNFIS